MKKGSDTVKVTAYYSQGKKSKQPKQFTYGSSGLVSG